jgi:hypothetical protein
MLAGLGAVLKIMVLLQHRKRPRSNTAKYSAARTAIFHQGNMDLHITHQHPSTENEYT